MCFVCWVVRVKYCLGVGIGIEDIKEYLYLFVDLSLYGFLGKDGGRCKF